MYSKHCPEPVNNLINFAVVGFPDLFWGPSTEHIPYQQEAYGPHRSPKKTVQINKHI